MLIRSHPDAIDRCWHLSWGTTYSSALGAKMAVWGRLDEAAELSLREALLTSGGLVGATVPSSPWAIVAAKPDGSIVAAASTMLKGGLFWSISTGPDGKALIIGPNVGDVVRSHRQVLSLDEEYLRGFARLRPAPGRTPYNEVHRIRPGVTARWDQVGRTPQLTEWSGPDAWPEVPSLQGRGVKEQYLAAIDAAVASSMSIPGPLAAYLSGGLDSTFVVATVARLTTPDRPVHTYSHAPHPQAGLTSGSNWDADDSPFAQALQRAYPDRVVFHRVINEELVTPLDAARAVAQRTWVPAYNPCNEVWLAQIEGQARKLGAASIFSGSTGNAAFSYDPSQAAARYARQLDFRALAAIRPRSTAHGVSRTRALYGRYLAHALNNSRRRAGQTAPSPGFLPIEGASEPEAFSRRGYLEWLSMSQTSAPARVGPSEDSILHVDPFTSPNVLALAASLTDREWCTGPYPRGFARRMGEGRVPDEVRLRSRRGGQGLDAWFAIRHERDRYLDEVRALATTPVLGGWVDDGLVRRTVEAWPWGEIDHPGFVEMLRVDRILSLADFIRMTQRRLQALPAAG